QLSFSVVTGGLAIPPLRPRRATSPSSEGRENSVMNDEDMHQRVSAARVARLATVNADGAPHLVPFCFALDGDVLYSAVDAKPKKTQRLQRLQNAAREPRVSVLVDHYEEDWARLWWVRLDGQAHR